MRIFCYKRDTFNSGEMKRKKRKIERNSDKTQKETHKDQSQSPSFHFVRRV